MRGRGAAAAAVFPLLLLVNAGMYIESGVVPCLLLQLTSAFHMRPGQQGLLGGVVYLSLSLGSPLAGWALRHFEQQRVIAYSILANLALVKGVYCV